MSNNKYNVLPGNIRIKLEPGTSRLNTLPTNAPIKIEPQERLTSLKVPRDLKLTASKNKVFKPNLNVTRNKKNETANIVPTRGRGRGGRGRGGERGRGPRGRNGQNLVQSQGVFSEGIADTMRRNVHISDRSHDSRDFDATKVMDRPTINKSQEWKVDKDHEEMVMKELLDDHIDYETEVENDILPIQLPISKGGIFSGSVKDEVKIPLKKIKEEKPDVSEDDTLTEDLIDLKTVLKSDKVVENGIADKSLFDVKEKLILFQFPDALPGIGHVKEPTLKETQSASKKSEELETEPDKEVDSKCVLHSINEGLFGKIVIYNSGKTRLVLGSNRFNIEIGPDPGFLQDIMSVPVNKSTRTGDMINLGSINGSAIVSPEWDDLLTMK